MKLTIRRAPLTWREIMPQRSPSTPRRWRQIRIPSMPSIIWHGPTEIPGTRSTQIRPLKKHCRRFPAKASEIQPYITNASSGTTTQTAETDADGNPIDQTQETDANGNPIDQIAETDAEGNPIDQTAETDANGNPISQTQETDANGNPVTTIQ